MYRVTFNHTSISQIRTTGVYMSFLYLMQLEASLEETNNSNPKPNSTFFKLTVTYITPTLQIKGPYGHTLLHSITSISQIITTGVHVSVSCVKWFIKSNTLHSI
jgi:hypothetical protein